MIALRIVRSSGAPKLRDMVCRCNVSWRARRGGYRVLYAVDEHAGVVTVFAAEHRCDVYRRR